jgi:hypothetical protein
MLLTFALYGDCEETERRAVEEYSISQTLLDRAKKDHRPEQLEGVYDNNENSSNSSSSSRGTDSFVGSDSRGPVTASDVKAGGNREEQSSAVAQLLVSRPRPTTSKGYSSKAAATDTDIRTSSGSDKGSGRGSGRGKGGSKNLAEVESMRGSPPSALIDTISALRAGYGGSVLGYLDSIGFGPEYRKRLQRAAQVVRKHQEEEEGEKKASSRERQDSSSSTVGGTTEAQGERQL